MMNNEQHETEISPVPETAAAAAVSRLNGAAFFLLVFILIFAVLAYGAVEAWAFGFISLLTGGLVVCWLADAWQTRALRFSTSLLQLPLGGLILIGAVQLLPFGRPDVGGASSVPAVASLSINPYATRFALIQLIVFAIFFAAAYVYVSNAERLRRTVAIVIVFGAAMAFFGILQRLASPEGIYGWRPTPQAIPFGSYVNQHHFAAFMQMTIGLTLALLVGGATKKDKRLLLVIALVLMSIGVLLTGSRGGLISLLGVVGFVLLTNFMYRHKDDAETGTSHERRVAFRRRLGLVGGAFGLVVLLLGAVLLLGGDAPLTRGLGFTGQADVSSGRLHFWAVAWEIFKDYPIIGSGLETFGTAFPQYDTWNGNYRVEQAHNDYLQTLSDSGLLGLACVAGFIFLLFKKGFQRIGGEHSHFRRSTAVGALAGCFGVLIHSFFDFPLRTLSNTFVFLLLAVMATAPIHFSKRSKRRMFE